MEFLGQINERQIFYCHIRTDDNLSDSLNFINWIAFTIVDNDDKHLLSDIITQCIDKGVCFTCSAGQLASLTEDIFDEEIVRRQIQYEELTGEAQNYDEVPMTTFHTNFDEGFWFASTAAQQVIKGVNIISRQVVCIDFTQQKVKKHLLNLIETINNGWLPSDKEFVQPVYDSKSN